MAFAVTQSCCNDASCISVCPVDCIHPTPGEPGFGETEMVYIDPRSCIDCGACADACPVDAIFPVESLTGSLAAYAEVNRAHFETGDPTGDPAGEEAGDPEPASWDPPVFPVSLSGDASGLRVAVVGTGPAASYTASALLTTSARVTMLDRLDVPGGLVRFGVAPDHVSTRAIGERFATVRRNPRLDLLTGVEVGRDVSHAELLAQHDAVVYAVGASADRTLGVAGEQLPGSLPARTVVGWYNDHPEVPTDAVDLTAARGRAVVVGNGNVALDLARVLLGDPDRLTGAAAHAVAALRADRLREVVLVGRRGPAEAAYSVGEVRALLGRDDLDVVLDPGPDPGPVLAAVADAPAGSKAAVLRGLPVVTTDEEPPPPGAPPRLVLRFGTVVESVVGHDRVEGLCLAPTTGGPAARFATGLVVRSVGYRSEPVAGLPFDEVTHTVPHEAGRVVDPATGRAVPATYVVGWIKRGPRGGIGSNRADAAETVASLVADANAGRTSVGRGSTRALRRLVRSRGRSEG